MDQATEKLLRDELANLALSGEQLLDKEIKALTELKKSLDFEKLSAALACIMQCEGVILVTGSGTSSSIARRMAHVFTCSGVSTFFLDSGQCQHGYSSIIRQQDVLIAISRGGETDEVNFLAQVAKNKGAKIVGIIENTHSSLSRLCDMILVAAVARENETIKTIPLSSTLAQAAVGDILCAAINRIHDFSPEEFVKFHPGGAVGKRIAY